jgi:hypothetical protein
MIIDKENYESSSYNKGIMMDIYFEIDNFLKHIKFENFETKDEIFEEMLNNKNYNWEVSKLCYKYDSQQNKHIAWLDFLKNKENLDALGTLYELEVEYSDEGKDVSDIFFRSNFPRFLCDYYKEKIYELSEELFNENWDYGSEKERIDRSDELYIEELDYMNTSFFGDRL